MKKAIFIIPLFLLFAFTTGDNRSICHVPMQASGLTATDYDLDGDMDIIVNHTLSFRTNWGGLYMLQNDGKGYFSYMDSIYDTIGWYNCADTVISNIFPDIIFNTKDSINILSTDGVDYRRSRFFIGERTSKFALGDIDGDYDLDVVFTSNNLRYWGLIYNLGNGNFSPPEFFEQEMPPNDIKCADINNDGRDDIVVTNSTPEVHLSTEDGFETITLDNVASDINISDIDSDGYKDIITLAEPYNVRIYKNTGNNSFESIVQFYVDNFCYDFEVKDFNNDGLLDLLFLTTPFGYNTGYFLYYNQGDFEMGDPFFIPITNIGEERRFMHCADMDGNGFVDILTSCQVYDTSISYASRVEILFNDGNGNFVENPLEDVEEIESEKTVGFKNYPNPFRISTTFEFAIKNESQIEISVYDLKGRLVKSITNKTMKGGTYKIKWGGLNNASQACKPGPHIAYLKVNGTFMQSIKLIIN